MITSSYVVRGNEADRRARLLQGSLADVARLEKALVGGWDVKDDLARARAYVKAFGGQW